MQFSKKNQAREKTRKETENDEEKCVGCGSDDASNDCDVAAVCGIT
jgi:hypothetical protein